MVTLQNFQRPKYLAKKLNIENIKEHQKIYSVNQIKRKKSTFRWRIYLNRLTCPLTMPPLYLKTAELQEVISDLNAARKNITTLETVQGSSTCKCRMRIHLTKTAFDQCVLPVVTFGCERVIAKEWRGLGRKLSSV